MTVVRDLGVCCCYTDRPLSAPFGTETVRVPRARIEDDDGKVREWRSKALPRYQRLTKKGEVLIAAIYLAGTNMRRVKRALFGLFEGAVSKGEPLRRHGFTPDGERQPRLAQGEGGLGVFRPAILTP